LGPPLYKDDLQPSSSRFQLPVAAHADLLKRECFRGNFKPGGTPLIYACNAKFFIYKRGYYTLSVDLQGKKEMAGYSGGGSTVAVWKTKKM
jgi:hypothetical protein